MGVKEILSPEEIDCIIRRATENGALVSYKTGADGSDEPYEINTTWYSALNRTDSDEDMALQVKRFVASRSIALVIPGVPAIYIHSLVGTKNDRETVERTKSNRDINRGAIDARRIAEVAKESDSKFSRIHRQLTKLHHVRMQQRAFHPNADQRVLMISPDVFAVVRTSPEGDQHVLALTNVTDREIEIEIPLADTGVKQTDWRDLLSDRELKAEKGILSIPMQPYDILWLT
jgi:sucrose phosphorylase